MSRFRTVSVPAKVKFISKSLLSADFALLSKPAENFSENFPGRHSKNWVHPTKNLFYSNFLGNHSGVHTCILAPLGCIVTFPEQFLGARLILYH